MEFGGENQHSELYAGAGRKPAKGETLPKNGGDASRATGLLQIVIVNILTVPWLSLASWPVLQQPCSSGSAVGCGEQQSMQGHLTQVTSQRSSSPQLQRGLPCSSVPAHLAREVGGRLMGSLQQREHTSLWSSLLCSEAFILRREMYWASDLWAWSKKEILELIPHFDLFWTEHACRNTVAVVITSLSLCRGPYSICSIRPSLPRCCPLRGQCYLVYPLCCQVYPLFLDSSRFPNWIKHSPLTYSFSTFFS